MSCGLSRVTPFGSSSASAAGAASSAATRMARARIGASSIGAAEGVEAWRVADVADRGIAVDERAAEERVLHAAHLVLDLEELAAVLGIGDPLEAILVRVGLHVDEAALLQPPVGGGKVGDVDLHVVAVVLGQRFRGFGIEQFLIAPDG